MQNPQQSAQNPDYYPRNPAQQRATGTRRSWYQVNRQRSGRAAAAAGRKQAGAQLVPGRNPGGAADTRRSAGGLSFLQVDRGRSGRQLVPAPGAIREPGQHRQRSARAAAGTPAQLVPGTGTRNSCSRPQHRARSGRPRSWYPLQLIPGTRHPARSGQNETPQRRGYQDRKKGRADNGKADGKKSRNRVNKRELETVLSG